MIGHGFTHPPLPAVLHWLAAGQLASRLHRAVRLWFLLHWLYDPDSNQQAYLPKPFMYSDLRDRLYAPTHRTEDSLKVEQLTAACQNSDCLCQQSAQVLLRLLPESLEAWLAEMTTLTGLTSVELCTALQELPFATVHRTIRDDLKYLVEQGWLVTTGRGRYACVPARQWPRPPASLRPVLDFAQLTPQQTWDVLRALQSIAFIQPNLELVIDRLWQQATQTQLSEAFQPAPQKQRIFIHLDYILSDETQEQVDDLQVELERLWQTSEAGVVQFQNWVAREDRLIDVTTYPVCLHYARRAKYLSTYGLQITDQLGWHNYRLDRIVATSFRVLAWGDPQVPFQLRQLRNTGDLPTAEQVENALQEAWGFNFYNAFKSIESIL
jgi:hypothetical protein